MKEIKKHLNEIEKKLKIDNSIIRYLTVKYKKLDTKNEFFKKINNQYEKKNKKFQKKEQIHLINLSLFQKNDGKFSKKCPLSIKNAPIIDYKNIVYLKNIFQIMEKLFHQK